MVAIAERPTEAPGSADGSSNGCEPVGLPPGRIPVEAVRYALGSYRAGVMSAERLIAVVDLHGDAAEREIARKACLHLRDFHRAIDRADVLAGYVATNLAQLEWLRSFPAGPDREVVPLRCPAGGGRHVDVPDVLAALRAVQLPPRAAELAPQAQRLDGRRGAAPSMAALADVGVTVSDVALELGGDRRGAWAILNGHQRAPPELQQALERLVGVDQAAVVLAGIPQHPRGHAPASAAVEALHAAGATAEDVAVLIPVVPSTVRAWLSGRLPLSPKLAPALEQLLGKAAAGRVLRLIPSRNGAR
jgi:hypothetical protein